MKRSYLVYLIVAALPSLVAVSATVVVSSRAWHGLRTASWTWVGTTALNAFQEDLVGTVDSLAAAGQPTPVNPEDPAWERIARGDTVSGLRPRGSTVEVMVLTGPRAGDPPGSLRYAGAPIPDAPLAVARATGSRLSLYLNGRRALTMADPFGPDSLPRQTLVALSRTAGGLALAGGYGGALVALDRPVGLPPAVSVMVGPETRPEAAIPRPLLLVVGLLFLFALVGGWVQLGGAPEADGGSRLPILVVFLVPVLTAAVFLAHTDWRFHEAARAGAAQTLTQALALASARGVASSPGQIHELTGFNATRVRSGLVEETTLAEPLDAVAALAGPPPSFTSSGAVTTSEGPSSYAALRLPEGGFVAVTARRPDARTRAFRRTLLLVAGILGAWLLVTGWMAGVGAREEGGRPVRQ